MASNRKLTGKALRFCREYVIDYDPEAAAIRAGYAPSGARGNAHRWLRDRRAREEIARIEGELLPEIGQGWIKNELYKIITKNNTADQVKVNALREMAKVVGAYEGDNPVPDTFNLILRRGRGPEDDDEDNGGSPPEAVAPAPTASE